jgi:hypothetical protein
MQSSIDDSVNATEWEIGIMRRLALQCIEISLVGARRERLPTLEGRTSFLIEQKGKQTYYSDSD